MSAAAGRGAWASVRRVRAPRRPFPWWSRAVRSPTSRSPICRSRHSCWSAAEALGRQARADRRTERAHDHVRAARHDGPRACRRSRGPRLPPRGCVRDLRAQPPRVRGRVPRGRGRGWHEHDDQLARLGGRRGHTAARHGRAVPAHGRAVPGPSLARGAEGRGRGDLRPRARQTPVGPHRSARSSATRPRRPASTIDPADAVVAMPMSSGTTGFPKVVQLTHRNLVANTCSRAAAIDIHDT